MLHLVLLSSDYDIFAMLMGYVMHVDICFVLVVFLPALEMLILPAFLDWHGSVFLRRKLYNFYGCGPACNCCKLYSECVCCIQRQCR